LKNSPAEKAGLLPKDVIYKIGDKYAAEYDLYDANMAIRGVKGTTVKLTILRKGVKDPFEVSIVRDSIDLNSVTEEKLDGEIVYLSINQFNTNTTKEFGKAVSSMILNPPKGLIIDLRYNGGGYLDASVQLLSYLLPKDTEAVKIRYRGDREEIQYTNGNPKLTNVPLVILINEGSASASEIMAGAIADHKRGIIMGTQSFGKGTVQSVENFSDGSSMRITIAQWFTPNGTSVNKVGLKPDIVKEISEDDITNKVDSQKNAAAEYLRNLNK
jgi:carboxyl-terminal processing protease